MVTNEGNPFEKALNTHNRYVEITPLNPDGLMSSLRAVYQAGEKLVQEEELGKINFATAVLPLYAGAMALNEQELVQPPLSTEQLQEIVQKREVLSLFAEANGETGQVLPTDPAAIPTAARK